LVSGRPRQFIVIKLNSRCSILFHLLVPGGKWQISNRRPRSSAKSCRATFHNRLRLPLLPPPSAVIISFLARGNRPAPISRHHRRTLAVAKRAVSWSIPTLTQPSLREMG